MIPDQEMVMQGQVFTIFFVIMDLPHKDAYPVLLGRLWTFRPKNVRTFRQGGKKIRLHTTKARASGKAMAPVYAASVNMLEGLTEEEANVFVQENLTLVSLSEIDVVKEAKPF
jgi:hypothetical protein